MRAAIYARVSTATGEQTTENQLMALRAIAERRGWELVAVYEDRLSGAKGRDKRPGLDQALKDASRRKYDVLATWAIDRLGRSLRDLVDTLEHLHSAGIDLYIDQQQLDTTSPSGKLLFQVIAAFSEFERSMIRARVSAGLARARREGRVLGRPRVARETEQAIQRALAGGMGVLKVAGMLSVGSGTVQRVKREMTAAESRAMMDSARSPGA